MLGERELLVTRSLRVRMGELNLTKEVGIERDRI